jgi:hypothetical protein
VDFSDIEIALQFLVTIREVKQGFRYEGKIEADEAMKILDPDLMDMVFDLEFNVPIESINAGLEFVHELGAPRKEIDAAFEELLSREHSLWLTNVTKEPLPLSPDQLEELKRTTLPMIGGAILLIQWRRLENLTLARWYKFRIPTPDEEELKQFPEFREYVRYLGWINNIIRDPD